MSQIHTDKGPIFLIDRLCDRPAHPVNDSPPAARRQGVDCTDGLSQCRPQAYSCLLSVFICVHPCKKYLFIADVTVDLLRQGHVLGKSIRHFVIQFKIQRSKLKTALPLGAIFMKLGRAPAMRNTFISCPSSI